MAADIDLIIPVPTIAKHRRQRSFDHTKLIAQELSRFSGTPQADLLQRTDNKTQVGARKSERSSQVLRSTKLRADVSALAKGKNILLIDDVITTGATVFASSTALKSAGAKSVAALAFCSGQA